MQEHTIIKIEQTAEQFLSLNDAEKSTTIFQILENSKKEVEEVLFSYHYEKRERVSDLAWRKEDLTIDGDRGTVIAYYQIGFSNACLDVNFNDSEKMKFNWKLSDYQLKMTGELWLEDLMKFNRTNQDQSPKG